MLLDAWPSVLRELPDAHLTIVGGGSLRAELAIPHPRPKGSTRASRCSHPSRRSELVALMDDSSCLVLPSRSEGLARIVLEAMARARAVVAPGWEASRRSSKTVNGRMWKPRTPRALAEALVDVLGDRDRAAAMGEESRRRVLARDPLGEYEAGMARLADWIRQV